MIPDGEYWLSTPRMTAWARVQNNKIVDSAPIFKKFINQPALNLWYWLDSHGNFYYDKLK